MRFRYTVDAQVHAQPLVVSHLRMADGKFHNVLFVATENDSVYAFDANNPTAGPRHNGLLWQDSFIDPANGVTSVPTQDTEYPFFGPTVGITGTPVIDRATQTLYVVSMVKEQPVGSDGPHYVMQFHALNLVNGKERHGGPTTIGDTTLHPDGSFTNDTQLSVPGTGAGSADGVVSFNALRELNRPGLVLDTKVPGHPDGVVFAGFAEEGDLDPYHGWLVGYDAKTMKLVTLFNTTPNGDMGGIWQAGAAPSVAPNGDLILWERQRYVRRLHHDDPARRGRAGRGRLRPRLRRDPPERGRQLRGLDPEHRRQLDGPVLQRRLPHRPADGARRQPAAGRDRHQLRGGGPGPQRPAHLPGDPLVSAAPRSPRRSPTRPPAPPSAVTTRTWTSPPASAAAPPSSASAAAPTAGPATMAITSWTYSSGGKTLIDHSGGFASNGDLTATGVATFNGAAADLTTDGGQQAGNIFANAPVNIQDFSTTFTFQMQPTRARPGAARRRPDLHHPERRRPPARPGLRRVVPPAQADPRDDDRGRLLHPLRLQEPGRSHDTDTGSTAMTLLPAFPGTAHPNLAVDGRQVGDDPPDRPGQHGRVNPGGPDRVLQEFTANPNGLIYSSPVYFDGKIYIQGVGDVIKAFALKLDPATNTMMIDETPVSQGTTVSGFPGEVQSVSADGTSNGIVWSPQVDLLHGRPGDPPRLQRQ